MHGEALAAWVSRNPRSLLIKNTQWHQHRDSLWAKELPCAGGIPGGDGNLRDALGSFRLYLNSAVWTEGTQRKGVQAQPEWVCEQPVLVQICLSQQFNFICEGKVQNETLLGATLIAPAELQAAGAESNSRTASSRHENNCKMQPPFCCFSGRGWIQPCASQQDQSTPRVSQDGLLHKCPRASAPSSSQAPSQEQKGFLSTVLLC